MKMFIFVEFNIQLLTMKRFLLLLAVAVAACTNTVNPQDYKSMNPEGMQKVQEFLKDTHYYFIATVDGDQPQVRPFGTAVYFLTNAKASFNSFTSDPVEIEF